MNSSRVLIALLFVSLARADFAHAKDETTVVVSLGAELSSINQVPSKMEFGDTSTDGSTGADKSASANVTQAYGLASINVTATATAHTGDLGVSFSGAGTGVPPFLATADAPTIFALAKWEDSGVIEADFPIPQVILNVLLSTGDPFNLPTHQKGFQFESDNANAQMHGTYEVRSLSQFYEMPPSPYKNLGFGQNVWAEFSGRGDGFLDDLPAPDTIPVRIPVVLGTSFDIGFEVTLRASGSSGFGVAQWSGDFSGSLHWAGIESITDVAGNPIPLSHFTITSESGFDYMKPFGVPEPSSLLLVASAAAFAYGLRPRRSVVTG